MSCVVNCPADIDDDDDEILCCSSDTKIFECNAPHRAASRQIRGIPGEDGEARGFRASSRAGSRTAR